MLKKISLIVLIISISAFLSSCNKKNHNENDKTKNKSKNIIETAVEEEHEDMCNIFFSIESPYTDTDVQSTITVFQNRLYNAGISECTVINQKNGTIKVTIPKNCYYDDIISYLTQNSKIEFKDYEENIIITYNDIKNAKYSYEPDETGKNTHLVEFELTDEGRNLFKEATEKISQYPTDQNIIKIVLDDTVISSPLVMHTIDSSSFIISGDFLEEHAKTLVDKINSGCLKNKIIHLRTEK